MGDKTKALDALNGIKQMLRIKTDAPTLTDAQREENKQKMIAKSMSVMSPEDLKKLEAMRKQRAESNEL